MNDVNVNSPDLKLVSRNDQKPARASASPQAVSSQAAARATPIESVSSLRPVSGPESSEKEGLSSRKHRQADDLKETVARLNDYIQSVQRNLEFQVDRESGQTVVKVVDQETEEVIRQIPDEVALRLAEKLQQDEPIVLLNVEV